MSGKHTTHASRQKSADKVKELLRLNYEQGRQDRCKLWVYRNIIRKETGISERTFFRYLKLQQPKEEKRDDGQLSLF